MRFLRSAPHCVRRSSRNDSELSCHPERSDSGVEGSPEIPPLAPTSLWLGRNDRGSYSVRTTIFQIQPIMNKKSNRMKKFLPFYITSHSLTALQIWFLFVPVSQLPGLHHVVSVRILPGSPSPAHSCYGVPDYW